MSAWVHPREHYRHPFSTLCTPVPQECCDSEDMLRLTYLGCSMLVIPARQPCWGGISGAISTPGEIQRLVLLVWNVRTIPAWNATIARAGEGRKGLKRVKNSTRRADGGQEPGVAKAIWCRVKPVKRFCCCSHLWAQNVSQTFQRGEGYSREEDSLLASPLPSRLSPSLPKLYLKLETKRTIGVWG